MRLVPTIGDVTVDRLRRAFEPEADAEWAMSAAAYMRDQFVFVGVRTPERRRLAKPALAPFSGPTPDDLRSIAGALWAQPEREFQYVACDYLAAHIDVVGADFIGTVGELITTKAWWDTVDPLAAHTVGPMVQRMPDLALVMDEWVGHDDIWRARTAILHQLTFKRATDADRLFAHCARRAADTEFFLRKAIGWALRSYAAVEPDAVDDFISATPSLSPLSVREAMKGVQRARTERHRAEMGKQ